MNPFITFENKICLVTGAGSENGIGFNTARILGELGARVYMVSTTDRIFKREAELRHLGIDSKGCVADLMDREQVKTLVSDIIAADGRIDVLVNNAGMVQTGVAEEDFTSFAELSRKLG